MSAVTYSEPQGHAPRSRTPVKDAQEELIYRLTTMRFMDFSPDALPGEFKDMLESFNKLNAAVTEFGQKVGAEIQSIVGSSMLSDEEIANSGADLFDAHRYALEAHFTEQEDEIWEAHDRQPALALPSFDRFREAS